MSASISLLFVPCPHCCSPETLKLNQVNLHSFMRQPHLEWERLGSGIQTGGGSSPLRIPVSQLFTEELMLLWLTPVFSAKEHLEESFASCNLPCWQFCFFPSQEEARGASNQIWTFSYSTWKIMMVGVSISKVFEVLWHARQIITDFLTEMYVSFWVAWYPGHRVPRLP